jgi:uncharacterized protein (DUF433 family)
MNFVGMILDAMQAPIKTLLLFSLANYLDKAYIQGKFKFKQRTSINQGFDMERISVNPKVYHGKPCIKGTRIPVHLILDLLGAGETTDNILRAYPHITREDILACIRYGAALATEETIYMTSKIIWSFLTRTKLGLDELSPNADEPQLKRFQTANGR